MEKLKAIDVKGKNYVMVNERLKYFREHFEGYALISDIIEITPDRVCILAKILDGNGSVKATGIAFEEKQSSYINKTSYIENCETSAWGRALANFGMKTYRVLTRLRTQSKFKRNRKNLRLKRIIKSPKLKRLTKTPTQSRNPRQTKRQLMSCRMMLQKC